MKSRKSKKIGLSPGSLIFIGDRKMENPIINYIRYNAEQYENLEISELKNKDQSKNFNHWIDLSGIHDADWIAKIGEQFNIHRLILEDILDPSQRSKIEEYDDCIYSCLHSFEYDKTTKTLKSEQISIFFNKDHIITFQENPDDTFKPIRDRLKIPTSRMRVRNTDYMFYAILDFLVDKYFVVLENMDHEISEIEDLADSNQTKLIHVDIYKLRSKLMLLRKSIAPFRDEIQKIYKMENELMNESTILYLRDLEDHVIHITEMIDSQRDLTNGIKDLIFQNANLSMNRDMRWLTVVSTLSIPILFFTGVYGMNFRHMPELEWRYAYLIWWIGIVVVIAGLVAYFRKKNLF